MTTKDDLARTMRINIHPDFLGESLARKKQESALRLGVKAAPPDESALSGQDQATKYEKLLESIYDAVLITDSSGRIIDSNSRALAFFLCEKEQLSGTCVIDLILGADRNLLEAIRKNLEDEMYTLIEAHCVRRDESTFPAEIAVNNIGIDDEGQLCFLIRDIEIRKRAQEALEEAVARLEEHDRARSLFVSNVSHELRTPLTSMIYAVTNMLKGIVGPLSPDVRRYLQMLEGDCKRLLGTVNDILDLRKIESDTLTLAKARVPFARLVRRSAESLRVQATQKSLAIELSTDERRWFVDCDAQKMERVVLNIVGNAVKFTPEGGTISVSLSEDPKHVGHVLLRVQDTGIGIPPDSISKVMERYFTVGQQPSGCGLGLAMAREIVELHGGTIRLQSPPPDSSTGTVVYVSVPTARPPTVLIVDDDEDVRELLKDQMVLQGYEVITGESGLDALELVEKEKPALVLLDLVLPKMEGTEVILKMKSDKSMMRIPIIVVTGAHVGRARAHLLNSFSIPAVQKPWDESDLLDRVEGAFLGAAALSNTVLK